MRISWVVFRDLDETGKSNRFHISRKAGASINCRPTFSSWPPRLADRSPRRFAAVIAAAFAGCGAIYGAVAASGFLAFGDAVAPNYLNSFEGEARGATAGRLARSLTLSRTPTIRAFPISTHEKKDES